MSDFVARTGEDRIRTMKVILSSTRSMNLMTHFVVRIDCCSWRCSVEARAPRLRWQKGWNMSGDQRVRFHAQV